MISWKKCRPLAATKLGCNEARDWLVAMMPMDVPCSSLNPSRSCRTVKVRKYASNLTDSHLVEEQKVHVFNYD